MRLRIAVGQIAQETNSFVPFRTTLEHFARRQLRRGQDVLRGWGDERTEVPGALEVLREAGAEVLPLICAAADSGGPVTVAAFEHLVGALVEDLRAALPLDAVVLVLHGAMVLEDGPAFWPAFWDDPESEILRRVRAAAPGVPVFASLDLHAHVTAGMLQPGVALVGYHCYPHVDMFETGQRVARLALDALAGRRRPVMAMAKRAMVPSPVAARTPDAPLAGIVARARGMERAGLIDASVFPVQPWIDVPGLGFGVLTCADGDLGAAQAAADELADLAWAAREAFDPRLVPLEEAIRAGLSQPGMTLVGDGGDAPTGGAAGDQAGVLRALLAAGAEGHGRAVLLTLCDPEAAEAAGRAGVGAVAEFRLGHGFTAGEKVVVQARVERLHDGRFVARDAGARGAPTDHGATAVLGIGAIRVVVRSTPGREWDTGIFRSAGEDPGAAGMVFVKSPGHFRVAFEPLAARTFMADTAGPTCGNTARVPWTRVTRPLWPLDP